MEEVLHVPLVVAGHVEGLVHWRDVEHDELVDVYGPVQGGHHDGAAAHAVPSQAHTAQIQLTGNKLRNIFLGKIIRQIRQITHLTSFARSAAMRL